MLSKEHHGPRAVLNALERLANGYRSQCETTRQDLAISEGQLRDYQARLGTPFLHDSYLSELTTLRDQLKVSLSGSPSEPGAKTEPTSAELADKIKVLKAAHTIEAAPALREPPFLCGRTNHRTHSPQGRSDYCRRLAG